MPKKSYAPYLQIRDSSGDYHAAAARISKVLTGQIDYTAGAAHALSFTDEYYKRLSKPIDYTAADTALLEDYIIHGYDYTIRAAAFAEWKRRISEAKEGIE